MLSFCPELNKEQFHVLFRVKYACFLQAFFPLGPISTMVYAGVGALIFCGYIIFDTGNLIKRFSYDEYIWASVVLYLDILNLFLLLLDLLKSNR
jgi:FtsH-binding integral membrane protein